MATWKLSWKFKFPQKVCPKNKSLRTQLSGDFKFTLGTENKIHDSQDFPLKLPNVCLAAIT